MAHYAPETSLSNVMTEDKSTCHVIVLYHRCTITGSSIGKLDAAVTFGDLADTCVKTVLKAGSDYHRIDVVFGIYRDKSIKGATRIRRRKAALPISRILEGRDVPLPKNWLNSVIG